MVKDEPGLRFERWGEELGPEALCMISGMTALDPKARLGIDQVMAHPFWLEDEWRCHVALNQHYQLQQNRICVS